MAKVGPNILGSAREARLQAIKRRKKRTVVVFSFVFALLFVAFVFVIYTLVDVYGASSMKKNYDKEYLAYESSLEQLDATLVSVATTITDCRPAVQDQKVCDTLDAAVVAGLHVSNEKMQKEDVHAVSSSGISQAITRVKTARMQVDNANEAVKNAIDPVSISKVDKVKIALQKSISTAEEQIVNAQKIVDETVGEVIDDRTRSAAQEAIGKVNAQIDGAKAVTGDDTAVYTAAAKSIDNAVANLAHAISEVQYSHTLWEREKQAEEERQKAEEQTQEDENSTENNENTGDATTGDDPDGMNPNPVDQPVQNPPQ